MAFIKPKSETSWAKLGIVFLVFLLALFLILYSGGDTLKFLKDFIQPTPSIGYESFRIAEGDQVGRTLFYKGKEGPIVRNESGRSYLGEGQVFISGSGENPQDQYYLVGPFMGWQEVEDSVDKYIVIRDPSTEMPLFFFSRVVLGPKQSSPTLFGVEDLDETLKQGRPVIQALGNLSEWDWTEMGRIIISQDAMVVVPRFNDKGVPELDEDNHVLVAELIIRRFGGKAQLEKELGRQIQ